MLLIVAIAAAAGAAAGPAAAAGPTTGTSSLGALATDGDRLVAWMAAPGLLRVADERTGTVFDHRVPEDCDGGVSELRLGGGRVALLCWDYARTDSRLIVLDAGLGAWREVPDPGSWRAQLGGGISLVGVGARWIRVATDTEAVLIDPQDGSRRPLDGGGWVDLDAEQPAAAPACGAFARPPVAYRAPYALGTVGAWIALWRCGAPRPVVLELGPFTAQLGSSGIVSWDQVVGNATARAYVPRCRAIFAWSGWSFAGIAHTRTALYTSDGSELRRVPLPRRCPRPPALRIRGAGGRAWTTVRAQLWRVRAAGAPLAQRPPGAAPAAPVLRRRSGSLELRLPHPATMVIWRIGPRRWKASMPGTDRRTWRFGGPRRPGLTRIAIEARDDDGTVAQRYLVAIRR